MIDKIKKQLGDKLEDYILVRPMYNISGQDVAHFRKNNIDMYVITDGEKIIDIQMD